jgi:hypothetical protein
MYWYEIYNELSNIKPRDTLCKYFIDTFLKFMEVKGMSIKKVRWEYIEGLPTFFDLTKMIRVGIKANKIEKIKKSFAENWYGHYWNNKDFWAGVYYSDHMKVVFEDDRAISDSTFRKHSKKLPYKIKEEDNLIRYYLELEKIHFFSLNKDEQQKEISSFIKYCYKNAKKMKR